MDAKTTLIIIILSLALLLAGCTQPNNNPTNPSDQNTGDSNPSNGGENTMQQTVQNGDLIQVNYKGTLSDGNEFDSSLKPGRTPLEFTVGAGQMIPGFDTAVVGMRLNEEKTVTLAPANAYGELNTEAQTFPKEQFGELFDSLTVGQKLQLNNGLEAEVTAKGSDFADVIINHPLAGKPLTF